MYINILFQVNYPMNPLANEYYHTQKYGAFLVVSFRPLSLATLKVISPGVTVTNIK